jgi:hypothetical protein
MLMLGEVSGRERTADEFRDLLSRTGFHLDRAIDAGLNTFVLDASAA